MKNTAITFDELFIFPNYFKMILSPSNYFEFNLQNI